MRDHLQNQGIKKPMEIIATGIDEDFFRPGDGVRFRAENGIDKNRPVLVHIGRVAYEKNIDFLLHMLTVLRKIIPDILFVIAGEGPAEEHLRDLVKTLKLNNNVLFVGYLDRASTLLDCYCTGDVFIFGSKIETQGLVLLEAMAQGVPVVSTSVLGTNDILHANKGALIAEEEINDFAYKVIHLLQNPELHAKLSNEAREYARTWSAREFAVKTESFYEKVINDYRLN